MRDRPGPDPIDRNGEPVESDWGCALVLAVACLLVLCGIELWAIFELAARCSGAPYKLK